MEVMGVLSPSFTVISEALKHVLSFRYVNSPIKVNSTIHMFKIKHLHKCFADLKALSEMFYQNWTHLGFKNKSGYMKISFQRYVISHSDPPSRKALMTSGIISQRSRWKSITIITEWLFFFSSRSSLTTKSFLLKEKCWEGGTVDLQPFYFRMVVGSCHLV